jgi:hypothetical protein
MVGWEKTINAEEGRVCRQVGTRYYEACRAVPALAPRGSESATDKRPW